jgi:hypothetical protein
VPSSTSAIIAVKRFNERVDLEPRYIGLGPIFARSSSLPLFFRGYYRGLHNPATHQHSPAKLVSTTSVGAAIGIYTAIASAHDRPDRYRIFAGVRYGSTQRQIVPCTRF